MAGCVEDSDRADLALWHIVDAGCHAPDADSMSPDRMARTGLQCDMTHGYAVLKDRCGASHYLVLPTARRSGIESAELLRADEPPYLALAWAQRWRSLGPLAAPAGVDPADRADLGLAVNSRYARSQAQLHVHIDFVRPEVRSALAALGASVATGSSVELMGHRYRLDRLDALTGNPFALVARAWNAQTEEDRARLTLAVVSDGARGYFLLSDRAAVAAFDRGHAEELLLERHCR